MKAKTCEFCGRTAKDVSTVDPKDGRDICGTGKGCLAPAATLRTPIPGLECERTEGFQDGIVECGTSSHRHAGDKKLCKADLKTKAREPVGEPYTFHSTKGGPSPRGDNWMVVPVNAPGIIRYAEARLADGDAKAPMAAMRILAAWPDCPARIAIAFAERKATVTYHDDRVVVQEVR